MSQNRRSNSPSSSSNSKRRRSNSPSSSSKRRRSSSAQRSLVSPSTSSLALVPYTGRFRTPLEARSDYDRLMNGDYVIIQMPPGLLDLPPNTIDRSVSPTLSLMIFTQWLLRRRIMTYGGATLFYQLYSVDENLVPWDTFVILDIRFTRNGEEHFGFENIGAVRHFLNETNYLNYLGSVYQEHFYYEHVKRRGLQPQRPFIPVNYIYNDIYAPLNFLNIYMQRLQDKCTICIEELRGRQVVLFFCNHFHVLHLDCALRQWNFKFECPFCQVIPILIFTNINIANNVRYTEIIPVRGDEADDTDYDTDDDDDDADDDDEDDADDDGWEDTDDDGWEDTHDDDLKDMSN